MDLTGIISAFTGVTTVAPVLVANGQTGITPNAVAPSVAVGASGDWLVGVWSTWRSSVVLTPKDMTVRRRFGGPEPLVLADKRATVAARADPKRRPCPPPADFWTAQLLVLRAGP